MRGSGELSGVGGFHPRATQLAVAFFKFQKVTIRRSNRDISFLFSGSWMWQDILAFEDPKWPPLLGWFYADLFQLDIFGLGKVKVLTGIVHLDEVVSI